VIDAHGDVFSGGAASVFVKKKLWLKMNLSVNLLFIAVLHLFDILFDCLLLLPPYHTGQF